MSQHRVPRSHLPGDAAGGVPGWQDRVTTAVQDNERTKADRRGAGMRNWNARLTVVTDVELRPLLRQAANARGISVTGYVRRATAAFIAADLGVPFAEVCAHMPRPGPALGTMRGLPPEQRPLHNPGRWIDDGAGYGAWEVGCAG